MSPADAAPDPAPTLALASAGTEIWPMPMDAPGPGGPYCAQLTDEPAAVLGFAVAALASGSPCVLATLVAISGGAARPLGAQMAIRADGGYCGLVSGGCVEPAVAAEALLALADGQDRMLRLGAGSGVFDIVLPCGGGITLALHVLRDAAPLQAVLASLAARLPAWLVHEPGSARFLMLAAPPAAGPGAFVRQYRPSIRLVIAGVGVEAELTEKLAQAAGYETWRGAGALPAGAIDAACAVALLHHDLARELPPLRAALASDAFYIGALGSVRTHRRRVAMLAALGHGAAEIARIKAPIGLVARTRTASALAFSVLADIAALRDVARD